MPGNWYICVQQLHMCHTLAAAHHQFCQSRVFPFLARFARLYWLLLGWDSVGSPALQLVMQASKKEVQE